MPFYYHAIVSVPTERQMVCLESIYIIFVHFLIGYTDLVDRNLRKYLISGKEQPESWGMALLSCTLSCSNGRHNKNKLKKGE